MRPEIIKETPVLMAEVKEALEEIKKKEELNFRAGKTYEHVTQFSDLTLKKAKEMQKKIVDLEIPRIREKEATKLVDVAPKTIEDVKLVLQTFSITLKEEQIKKILELFEKKGKEEDKKGKED